MNCEICNAAENSCDEKPFRPPKGTENDKEFVCNKCGRKWKQYNTQYHLWVEDGDKTTYTGFQLIEKVE